MKAALQRFVTKAVAATRGGDVAARRLGVNVGSGCRILTQDFGSEPWLVTIGDRVTLSGMVQFLTHDGAGWLFNDEKGRRFRYARIEIGSDVFVGNRAILMPGVRIGDRCVVGAGSVVTKSVPSGSVVAGNPARRITSFDGLMARVSAWPSSQDAGVGSLQDRVSRIVDPDFAPPL